MTFDHEILDRNLDTLPSLYSGEKGLRSQKNLLDHSFKVSLSPLQMNAHFLEIISFICQLLSFTYIVQSTKVSTYFLTFVRERWHTSKKDCTCYPNAQIFVCIEILQPWMIFTQIFHMLILSFDLHLSKHFFFLLWVGKVWFLRHSVKNRVILLLNSRIHCAFLTPLARLDNSGKMFTKTEWNE